MEKKKIETFEDLDVWNEAMDLAVDIYEITTNWKDYDFRRQLQRATVSISSNIAEGFERQTNKEFIQFLYIAKGSCGEVCSQTILATRVGLLDNRDSETLRPRATQVSRMLAKLIQYRTQNP